QALVGLAGSGFEHAQTLTQELLEQGGSTAQRLVDAISIVPLGPGFDVVLDGLANAGEAGKNALEALASAGLERATDYLQDLIDFLNPFS
nr:hypothetical protein [Gammaproteobacteria bacterium]